MRRRRRATSGSTASPCVPGSAPFGRTKQSGYGRLAEVAAYISRSGLTQAEAARRFRVTQPRISDLTRGKIDIFSIDALVNMLTVAGLRVEFAVRPPKAG
ncbi:MAG: helix-turn-helix domain-containing protein [Acidimicrobiia bacterium]